tara:strand:- start:4291 stop:4857 length:567 start_codon:yes stop_codon:yes gene_type:complete
MGNRGAKITPQTDTIGTPEQSTTDRSVGDSRGDKLSTPRDTIDDAELDKRIEDALGAINGQLEQLNKRQATLNEQELFSPPSSKSQREEQQAIQKMKYWLHVTKQDIKQGIDPGSGGERRASMALRSQQSRESYKSYIRDKVEQVSADETRTIQEWLKEEQKARKEAAAKAAWQWKIGQPNVVQIHFT